MFSDIQKVPPAPAPNAVASVPSREPLRQQTDRTNERMHTLKEVQEYIHAIQLADAREKEKILAKFEEKERKLVSKIREKAECESRLADLNHQLLGEDTKRDAEVKQMKKVICDLQNDKASMRDNMIKEMLSEMDFRIKNFCDQYREEVTNE
jgi:hypothetical protein